MKDVIKTSVTVLVVMIILVVVFFIVGNAKYGIEILSTTNLDLKDPTTKLLYERIKDTTSFRKADMKVSSLNSEEIIPYIILNLDKDDYSTKTVEPEKIVCEVTGTIKFTSSKDCKVKVIKNDTISKYQKKIFNVDTELVFDDFNQYGLNCKNNGEKYYCLIGSYTDTLLGYSVFDSAYEYQDKITVVEYYLQIDLSDKERCLKFFNEEYCTNYKEMDKPSLSDKTIKENGVLYKHEFYKEEDKYYLENSFIVSEG